MNFLSLWLISLHYVTLELKARLNRQGKEIFYNGDNSAAILHRLDLLFFSKGLLLSLISKKEVVVDFPTSPFLVNIQTAAFRVNVGQSPDYLLSFKVIYCTLSC